jgi:hypothetical protein
MSNRIAESYLNRKLSSKDTNKRYSNTSTIPSKHEYAHKYKIYTEEYPDHYDKHKKTNRYSSANEDLGILF